MLKLFKTRLDPSDPKYSDKIESIKSKFLKEIAKTRIYKDYQIFHHSDTISDEAVYQKFIIGGEAYHKTKNVDYRRLERLHWVHEIIDYMIKNDFKDPSNQIKIHIKVPDDSTRFLIYDKFNYIVILNIDLRKKRILISTAYVPEDNYYKKISSWPIINGIE